MLFSNTQEINQIIPSAKFQKIDNIISRLNSEEMSALLPITGMPLLEALRTDYERLSTTEGGGIWANYKFEPEDAVRINILRTVQEILLFSYMANNSSILQSSFNIGGGFNKPYTGDYDSLDSKDNERLDKSLWHNARRSKENLLIYLEMDAQNLHIYTNDWKQSNYYYQHSDLLFTTPSELHPLYINLGDAPHLNFQAYISILHDCQDGYLAGQLGYPLLQALIERKYQQAPVPDGSAVGESQQAAEPSGSPAENNSQLSTLNSQLSIWQPLDRHVRTALANFAEYEKQGAKQSLEHIQHRGQSQLTLAVKYVHDHYDDFLPYIPIGSPLYDPAIDPRNKEEQNPNLTPSNNKAKHPNPPHCPPPPHHGTVFSLLQ